MTYLADLAPESTRALADEANAEWFQENLPGWKSRERMGIDLLDERDFPAGEDTTNASDWDWFIEDSFVDPAEVA